MDGHRSRWVRAAWAYSRGGEGGHTRGVRTAPNRSNVTMWATLGGLPVVCMTVARDRRPRGRRLRRGTVIPSTVMRAPRVLLPIALRRQARTLRILGTVAGFVLLLRVTDLAGAWGDARHADLRWVAAGLAVSLLGFAVGAVQWGVLLRHRSGSPGWASIAAWQAQSVFATHVLPTPVAGDAVRAVNAGRATGAGVGVASILGSRLASGLGIAAWGMLGALVMLPRFGPILLLGAALYLGAMLAAWALVLSGRSIPLPAWARRGGVRGTVGRAIASLRDGFGVIASHRRGIAMSVGAGMLGWALHLLAFVALARAVGADVPIGLFAVAAPLSLVATWVPVSVNGMGLREGVLAGVLVHAGITPAHAGAASLLVDAQMLPVACAGALVWLVSSRRAVRPAALAVRA